MPTGGRRIVTGINAQGKSYFVHNGITPKMLDAGVMYVEELWYDDPAKPDPDNKVDPVVADIVKLEPAHGGSTFRMLTLYPESEGSSLMLDSRVGFDDNGTIEDLESGFHTSATIDYIVVLSGSVCLILDEGEVELHAGDVAIQRATRHAWKNRSDKPCVMAGILIDSPNYRQAGA